MMRVSVPVIVPRTVPVLLLPTYALDWIGNDDIDWIVHIRRLLRSDSWKQTNIFQTFSPSEWLPTLFLRIYTVALYHSMSLTRL